MKKRSKSIDSVYTHSPRLEFLRQVQDNMVPQWRKNYVNALKMDRKLQSVFNQVNGSQKGRGGDLLVNISDGFKKFFIDEIDRANQFYDISYDLLRKQVTELAQIEPQALSKQNRQTHEDNLRGVYKNLVFVSNFQMLNCSIVYYFKDCYYNLVKICNHVTLDDISREILDYLNNSNISNLEEMRGSKALIIDLLKMMNVKATALQVQAELDQGLMPEHTPKENMINAFFIGLFIGLGITLLGCVLSCITWEFYPNNHVILQTTKFQQLCIRFSLAVSFYQLGAAVMLSLCEYHNINWEFLVGLDKSANKYGARSVATHALVSWCVAAFCCSMSMASQAQSTTEESVILQMMFGRYLGVFAKYIPADIWLLLPLALSLERCVEGLIRQKLLKKPSLNYWILLLVYKLHQPFGHSITFVMSAASVNAVGINTMYVDLGDMLALLFTRNRTAMPAWCKQLFLLFPSFVRNWYLVKKYQEKKAFNPHGLNFIKYLLIIPFSFQFYDFIRADDKIFYGMVGSRGVELIYNIIWDFVQDFGQFNLYGDGLQKFKDKPEFWAHPFLVRRPTLLPIWSHVFAIIVDFLLRILWCFRFWTKIPFCQGFMYDTIILFGGLARCALWCLFRFDNQQVTNQGDMLTSLYIPQKIQMSAPTDFNDQLYSAIGTNFNEENTQLSRVGSIQDFRASEMTNADSVQSFHGKNSNHNMQFGQRELAVNNNNRVEMNYYADEGDVEEGDRY